MSSFSLLMCCTQNNQKMFTALLVTGFTKFYKLKGPTRDCECFLCGFL